MMPGMRLAVLLAFLASCGSVDVQRAGGTGGAAGAAGGSTSASGGRASAAGSGGEAAAGASGAAGTACLGGNDVQGFAYNHGCDGGTTSPTTCHAACELNSSQFVGCVNDARVDGGIVICHATCSECR